MRAAEFQRTLAGATKSPALEIQTHGRRPPLHTDAMATDEEEEELNLYDEIEIEDCFYDETLQIYHHPCPCGDRFEISIADMRDGEDIARCPSCSLMIRIIFDAVCICSNILQVNVLTCGRRISPRKRSRSRMRRRVLPSPCKLDE